MVSFRDYIKQRWNLQMPEGEISGAWFSDNGIPMVVRCSCCDMTMASPSAWIDDEGYTYCGTCADIDEELE